MHGCGPHGCGSSTILGRGGRDEREKEGRKKEEWGKGEGEKGEGRELGAGEEEEERKKERQREKGRQRNMEVFKVGGFHQGSKHVGISILCHPRSFTPC